jgi:hypothetical protein
MEKINQQNGRTKNKTTKNNTAKNGTAKNKMKHIKIIKKLTTNLKKPNLLKYGSQSIKF